MKMTDALIFLLQANAGAGAAILVTFVLRVLLRDRLDPRRQMWIWLAPAIAALTPMFPREVDGATASHSFLRTFSLDADAIGWVWLSGAVLSTIVVAIAHGRFLRTAALGRAGPAVVGVWAPRIVMPDDVAFSEVERRLIRAHEREHIRRNDPLVRAVLVAIQCLCWFNPLVHLAAAAIRLDMEIACDAGLELGPGFRRIYAEAMIRCEAGTSSWLSCAWTATALHPLEIRIRQLARPNSSVARQAWTCALAGAATAIIGLGAWWSQPPSPIHHPFLVSLSPRVTLVDITPPVRLGARVRR